MGLLSVHGKQEADRLKLANQMSHAQIYARMLGIEMGEPELEIPEESRERVADFVERNRLLVRGPLIGLNTGAGGRWVSKKLSIGRTIELVGELRRRLDERVCFLLLGGRKEAERNAAILAELDGQAPLVDSGSDNSVLDFAALIDRLDLLISSDSLALHIGVARKVPLVAFFAPTSAAEIELYGRGEKVKSLAPDYCSYRSDADTSTLTAERLADAAERVLGR
jgi:heptosyltransferase-2